MLRNGVDQGPRVRTTLDIAFEDPTPSLQRLARFDPGSKVPRHVPTPEQAEWLRADARALREDLRRRRIYGQ